MTETEHLVCGECRSVVVWTNANRGLAVATVRRSLNAHTRREHPGTPVPFPNTVKEITARETTPEQRRTPEHRAKKRDRQSTPKYLAYRRAYIRDYRKRRRELRGAPVETEDASL